MSETTGFPARFPGRCPECVEAIEVGQPIRAADFGHGTYIHVTCPDQPDEKPTRFAGTTLEEMGF